jgi:hypothetical protein
MTDRCKIGKRMIQRWAQDVQNATMQTWQQEMFKPRAYDQHVLKCRKCSQTLIKAPLVINGEKS